MISASSGIALGVGVFFALLATAGIAMHFTGYNLIQDDDPRLMTTSAQVEEINQAGPGADLPPQQMADVDTPGFTVNFIEFGAGHGGVTAQCGRTIENGESTLRLQCGTVLRPHTECAVNLSDPHVDMKGGTTKVLVPSADSGCGNVTLNYNGGETAQIIVDNTFEGVPDGHFGVSYYTATYGDGMWLTLT